MELYTWYSMWRPGSTPKNAEAQAWFYPIKRIGKLKLLGLEISQGEARTQTADEESIEIIFSSKKPALKQKQDIFNIIFQGKLEE